jgi:hypothetical protein
MKPGGLRREKGWQTSGSIIAVPITYSANRFQSFNRYVGPAAGAVSLVFGLFLVHQIGFVDGLLR